MYRRPQASPAPQEGWAGQKKDLGVCPGSNSRHPLTRDPWLCPAPAPIRSPKHPDTNTTPPQTTGGSLRVWPPNLLSLPPLSWVEEGVARQGKRNMRVARWWHSSLTFTPGATAPFLTHGSQILPPHLPPPRLRLSYIQEGKIL